MLSALLYCGAVAAARADVTIRLRRSNLPYEETIYLKGTSQRRQVESQYKGKTFSWAWLDDCPRRRFIGLDLINHTYTLYEGGVPAAAVAAFNETQFPPVLPPPGSEGVWTETVRVTDTGERRELFGFAARRLKTLTTWAAAPHSCDTSRLRMETDGWYIDLLYGIDCSPDLSGATPRMLVEMPSSKCMGHFFRHKYLFQRRHEGPPLGFAVAETTSIYNERGLVSTRTQEVLSLSTAPLDDALFAVPPGYVRVEPEHRRFKPSLIERARALFRKD